MINREDFKLFYNENICVLYIVPSNKLLTMNANKAPLFEMQLNNYFAKNSSAGDAERIEEFLNRSLDEEPSNDDKDLFHYRHLRKLEILLTNHCNLSCRYCYADRGSYHRESFVYDSEQLRNDLQNFFPVYYDQVDTVFFFGGEPLINIKGIETVCDFFASLHSRGEIARVPVYTIVTNGTLISEEIATLLKKYEVNITISLDIPKVVHDSNRVYCSGQGTYEDVIAGIKRLQCVGTNFRTIEVTYNKEHIRIGFNRHKITEMIHTLFPDVNTIIADCCGDNDVALNNQDRDISCISQKDYTRIFKALSEKRRNNYSCDVCERSFMLTPNATIYPCHMFYKDKAFSFSDKQGYEELRKKIQSVNRIEHPVCKRCWAKYLCNACPASLLLDRQGSEAEMKKNCPIIREKIKNILLMIAEDSSKNQLLNYERLVED